ncbi:MAG: PEP-CTERM sorting domain-containing protein [Gemmatimonadetes bacterium]|nr:PEP-CTERM sorting domain-containing protein [Gemmatimonadota bacterium]
MRLPSLLRLAATLVLVALPATARAQFAVYTDFASFLAATSNAGTDTFGDLFSGDTPNGPLNRTAGAFAYTANVNTSSFYVNGGLGGTWLSTNVSTDIVTFDGFSPSMFGIGGTFFNTDEMGAEAAGTSLTLTAFTAGGSFTHTLTNPGASSFFGIVATDPFASVTVQSVTPAQGFAWPTVGSLTLAAAPQVVPEPSTFVLLAVGVVGMVAVARRRRAA